VLIWAALGSATVVAATAFSGSYQHQYQLAIRFGQAHWYAGMQPVSVEGLVVTATLMMAFAALAGRRARQIWPAYLALFLGTSQAALMNVAASHFDWWWLGIEISVWPAVAFFVAYEMAVWMIRNRPSPEVTANEGQKRSAAPPTPEIEIPDSDDLPEDDPLVTVPKLILPEVVPIPPLNGELVHTCNEGRGPKGGKKTPGCPRCDALLAGTIAPRGGRR
jgi:hypothetical protein